MSKSIKKKLGDSDFLYTSKKFDDHLLNLSNKEKSIFSEMLKFFKFSIYDCWNLHRRKKADIMSVYDGNTPIGCFVFLVYPAYKEAYMDMAYVTYKYRRNGVLKNVFVEMLSSLDVISWITDYEEGYAAYKAINANHITSGVHFITKRRFTRKYGKPNIWS